LLAAIVDHELAVHEIITDGVTSIDVRTETLEGAEIGQVDMLVNDLDAQLSVYVGARVYDLIGGELVERQ
jgi:hypothetical protein